MTQRHGAFLVNDVRLAHLRRFAYWMDEGIQLPGTRFRIGLDPIIGLVPILGDAAGGILATWILLEAAHRGASRATLGRIASNIAIDALVGAIPFLGDAFDFVWKSNLRNIALLELHLTDRAKAAKADRFFLLLLGGGLLLLCGTLLAGSLFLAALLFRALGGH